MAEILESSAFIVVGYESTNWGNDETSIYNRCCKKKNVILSHKNLFYYFIISFYNILFIRCFIIQFYILK